MRRILARVVAAALLAAPLAAQAREAAPAHKAGPRSTMVFVGAQDRGAESSALRLGMLVETAAGHSAHYELKPLRDAAGERVPTDARVALRNAETALSAGQSAFSAGKLEDAEQQLRAAVKGYEQAAAGLYKMDAYADANAYLAAVCLARHHDDDAKDALTQALAVEPRYRLDDKLQEQLAGVMRTVRHELADGHKGSVSIYTTPAGGQVFVDGEPRGFGPLSIDRLPVGRHLVRFEKPGYMNVGQVVDVVSTDDTAVKARFSPTEDFASEEESVVQALKEVDSTKCGPATFALLKHYGLDRAIFANVSTTGDNLVLDLSLVDGLQRRRIAHRRNSFVADDAENVARETNRLVTGLLADAEAEDQPRAKSKASDDPLDSVSGMEDWGDDEDAPRKKRHGDDE